MWFISAAFILIVLCVPGNLVADSFSTHMKNARKFKSKEEIESAIAEYQEALKEKPSSNEARSQLESAYELLGDRMLNKGAADQAIEAYQNALRIQPNSNWVQSHLELAYEQLGDRLLNNGEIDRALEAYQNALRTQPNSMRAQSWIGMTYERLGDRLFNNGETDRAINAYRNALASVPEDPYYHEQLGIALEKIGDRGAATNEYHTAFVLSPLDGELQSKYEKVTGGSQGSVAEHIRKARIMENIPPKGAKVSNPSPTFKPEPGYTERAREAKLQGTLTLWIVIDSEGNVADTGIIKPLGMGLDAKALETVRTWKFKPAMREGTQVPARAMVELSFRLR